MVLQALRLASKADTSSTSRPPLQNSRITSFFAPLSHTSQSKAERKPSAESTRNTAQSLVRSGEVVDASAERVSTPPSSETKKRKAIPRRGNAIQGTGNQNENSPQHNGDMSPQASLAGPDSQPASHVKVKTSQETRTLRSKEKAQFKSELSMYFSNYEEIMANAPRSPDFLKVDEPIYIVDEPLKTKGSSSPAKSRSITVPTRPRAPSTHAASARSQVTSAQNEAKTVQLPSPAKSSIESGDPFADDKYLIYHRRAERREKQLRNIEKERAQHEKAHLERILEGLQGPDWLKVLGVTGVTESEQKEWRPKRDHFIREVADLVDKFERWKEEERRQRLKKEREREAEQDDNADAVSSSSAGASSSDLDARAALQLLQEAGQTPKQSRRRRSQHVLYEAPPSPEQPFTGFYKDPRLRAQALGETRHGRHMTAFGVALPDPPEAEFELYDDWTTHDSRRAREHKRRKLKREPHAQRQFI
ncbi:uncharacterized protein PV09_01571 [Verruconis gallopava]|uniref:Something about silencing protein 4 domain-containing protein n=1 Tax=Verruconis gallopava TaxID=253628 RepID=A0A0D2B8P3_9PEZI|nr:uncharacterized protein PV09_01571 [Verruconis gallopava]KIW07624.1 hypothetical protein PV09_01571 [Verruconis gallopava]